MFFPRRLWAGLLRRDLISGDGGEVLRIRSSCAALAPDFGAYGEVLLHTCSTSHPQAEVLAQPFHMRNSGPKSQVQGLCVWHPMIK